MERKKRYKVDSLVKKGKERRRWSEEREKEMNEENEREVKTNLLVLSIQADEVSRAQDLFIQLSLYAKSKFCALTHLCYITI